MLVGARFQREMPKGRVESKIGAAEDRTDCKCGTCSKVVLDADNGVLCELCDNWFHGRCQSIPEAMYKAISQYGADLHWFCKGCNGGANKVLAVVIKMQAKLDNLENEMIKVKADLKQGWKQDLMRAVEDLQTQWHTKLEQCQPTDLRRKVGELETKLEAGLSVIGDRLNGIDKAMEDGKAATSGKPLWSDIVSKSDAVDSKLADIVVEVQTLQKQTSGIQQDRAEQDEQNKRRNCVIIQGMKEPDGTTGEERKKADFDNVTELLHAINCDNISVNSCFRLGKFSEGPVVKPRPVKLVLPSEAQKQQVLQSAKNLKGNSNGLATVFIHQDLTPRQREARQLLVKQLKERQSRGETNLLIVGDSIVKRRPQTGSAVV